MTAIKLYEKETGKKMPSNQVAILEWNEDYVKWLENKALNKNHFLRSVTKAGYVAMNKGEFDLSNMTFYNSGELEKAKRHWGNKQQIVRVKVTFESGEAE